MVDKVLGEQYKFDLLENKTLSDVYPDASRRTKKFFEIVDLIGKGLIIGKVTPKARAAFKKASEVVTTKFIEEYHLPREVLLDAGKVKSILRGGNKDKFSPAEQDLLLDLGLSGTQYRQALKDGIAIKIPAEKITKLVDRPWWGKVKSTLRVGSQTEKIVSRERAGELSEAPKGLLTEGKPITEPIAPAKPIQPVKVQPQVEPPASPVVKDITFKEAESNFNKKVKRGESPANQAAEFFGYISNKLGIADRTTYINLGQEWESFHYLNRSDVSNKAIVNYFINEHKGIPSKPTPPAVEKPKLTESETNELSALKETLTSTFERLSDPNATNTQLLQSQKSALRMIKLIQDKEPEFKAPDFPFESDINEVDASSLRQVISTLGIHRQQKKGLKI